MRGDPNVRKCTGEVLKYLKNFTYFGVDLFVKVGLLQSQRSLSTRALKCFLSMKCLLEICIKVSDKH